MTTYVNVLIDESGSMQSVKSQIISGFNEYIQGLKKVKGKVRVSLTKFDSTGVKPEYVAKKRKEVPELTAETYSPGAMTPLYDAVGEMVRAVEKTDIKKQDNVLVVIQTDGFENCSKEFTEFQIKSLVEEKTKDGWTFVYLGADQDAWAPAAKMGIAAANTLAYASTDTAQVVGDRLTRASVAYAANSKGTAKDDFFSDKDSSSG